MEYGLIIKTANYLSVIGCFRLITEPNRLLINPVVNSFYTYIYLKYTP